MQIRVSGPAFAPVWWASTLDALAWRKGGQRRAGFLGDAWCLARPFWTSDEAGWAWRRFGLLLAAKMAAIWICVQQNHWYNDFYTAFQSGDPAAFLTQMGVFALIAAGFVVSAVTSHWLAEAVKLRWRDWMVRRITSDWLSNRAYHRLQLEGREDNPDQRIVEDLGLFAGQSINLLVGTLDMSVSLLAFTHILWGLSGRIEVAGFSVAGYMVFAVFGYTMLASWITHLIGRPLIRLHADNLAHEADFRYGLVRLRENAETIAFYRGEAQEARILRERWIKVVDNFRSVIRREQGMSLFTQTHGQFGIVLPFLLSAPRFFSGQITFAQVMQVAAASATVQTCLNFFITSYAEIAQWRAIIGRLTTFQADLDRMWTERPSHVAIDRQGESLVIRGLSLSLPDRSRRLIEDLDLEVAPGEALLIKGPSGTGKSTVLRALAGLWPYGEGRISLGAGDAFFLPQRPYLPLGTLRQAVFYPEAANADEAEVRAALEAVGLGHLVPRLDEIEPWSRILSGGEQQRIAFARVLLAKPGLIFLDEATSALDETWEACVYQLLRKAEWRPALVSVGHRSTLTRHHDRVFELRRPEPVRSAPEHAPALDDYMDRLAA